MDASACAFARREQAGQRRAAVEVGRDPAHRVMSGRNNRYRLTKGVDADPSAVAHEVWKAAPQHDGVEMGDRDVRPPAVPWQRAPNMVARHQLAYEPPAISVNDVGPCSTQRFGGPE